MTVLLRSPLASSFLITVVESRGSRSLITVVRSRSRSRSRSWTSPTLTPAPTGPTRTPTSSANAGAAITPMTAATNKDFLMSILQKLNGRGMRDAVIRSVKYPRASAEPCSRNPRELPRSWNNCARHSLVRMPEGHQTMGELLDALNELDERATAPEKPEVSFVDLAAQIFQAASQTVNQAIEVLQEPNMPLDMLGRWTR